MILKAYIFSLLYGVLCLGLAFLAYKLGVAKNYTRNLVHILVGTGTGFYRIRYSLALSG